MFCLFRDLFCVAVEAARRSSELERLGQPRANETGVGTAGGLRWEELRQVSENHSAALRDTFMFRLHRRERIMNSVGYRKRKSFQYDKVLRCSITRTTTVIIAIE